MRNSIQTKASFTLVEALLVVSMLSLVSLALFHTFINGLKIWDRSRQFVVEEDVAIFFDKAGEDLRNAVTYSQIPFNGKESSVSFPSRVKILDPVRNRISLKIGLVEYRFDTAKKIIVRRQADYGEALNASPGAERVLVRGVQAIKFSYYVLDGTQFVEEVKSEKLPAALSIEVEFKDRRGTRFMKKMINLPIDS